MGGIIENLKKDNTLCCGCGACVTVCPVQALKRKRDDMGFDYPVIQKSLCVECGLCKKVCAFENNNPLIKEESTEQSVYAGISLDSKILDKCSSGGVAHIITNHFICNGYSVYGCVNENQHIVHRKLENANEADGSKYVQSDLNDTFVNIKNELDNGHIVLFIGVSCQVDAIKKYLHTALSKEKISNLYTIDILCHGVPSPGVFESYCKWVEEKHSSKIVSVEFRNKKLGYTNCTSGNKIDLQGESSDNLNLFYNLYFEHIILRPSCTRCSYTTTDRVSDITLSDFWNIKDYHTDFPSEKGVSRIIVNTEKGKEIFEKIKYEMHVTESSISSCDNVKQFVSPPKIIWNKQRNFFRIYKVSPKAAFNSRLFFVKVKGISNRFKRLIKND